MAVRGMRKTPTYVKLMTGNPSGRKMAEDETPDSITSSDRTRLGMPSFIKGNKRVEELWHDMLPHMPWLTHVAALKFAEWCDSQAEFETDRHEWSVARRAEHRRLGSELGFDPVSRVRIGQPSPSKKDLAEDFFADIEGSKAANLA